MASKPHIPEATPPAQKPERQVDIQPEDVKLGADSGGDSSQGKRQLKRPRTSGGTGLQM